MKTVSFCTLGCRVNQYESRALAELFVKQGYTVVEFGKECDVCVVNTCAVTAESERKSAQMIRRAGRLAKDVRVCGCFIERNKGFDEPFITKKVGCVGKTELADVDPDFTEKGFELSDIGTEPPGATAVFSPVKAFVKIQDGCAGKCAYCIIPSLRGGSRSRPAESVEAEVRRLAAGGCREIVLTGIETAAYNRPSLPELIRRVASINGICRIRLGSLDPNALTEEFIKTASDIPEVMPHFHLSVQSGCDRILKLMRRPYTVCDVERKIQALKAAVPNAALSADIICSFPTETEDELEETLDFLKRMGFSHIHAFSYSKRPGTAAALMDGQIPEDEKRRRMRRFVEQCRLMERAAIDAKVGKADMVLVEKVEDGSAFGHTEDFTEAEVRPGNASPGDLLKVTAVGREGDRLICETAE